MNRIEFIGIIGGTIGVVGTIAYLLSDRSNLVRADLQQVEDNNKRDFIPRITRAKWSQYPTVVCSISRTLSLDNRQR